MGVVRHLLLVKFKPGTTPEQHQALVDDAKMLPRCIPLVKDSWLGFDVGRGNADFTLCMDFACVEDFDEYARHPAHHAFFAKISPVMMPHGLTATLLDPDHGSAMRSASRQSNSRQASSSNCYSTDRVDGTTAGSKHIANEFKSASRVSPRPMVDLMSVVV